MNTLEQQLAAHVHERVAAHLAKPSAKQYGAMAHRLPILIRSAGLAQALYFVEMASKKPANEVYQVLLDDIAQVTTGRTKDELQELVRQANLNEYVYLTRKTMLALKWFKRFSQSVLKSEVTDDHGDGE